MGLKCSTSSLNQLTPKQFSVLLSFAPAFARLRWQSGSQKSEYGTAVIENLWYPVFHSILEFFSYSILHIIRFYRKRSTWFCNSGSPLSQRKYNVILTTDLEPQNKITTTPRPEHNQLITYYYICSNSCNNTCHKQSELWSSPPSGKHSNVPESWIYQLMALHLLQT